MLSLKGGSVIDPFNSVVTVIHIQHSVLMISTFGLFKGGGRIKGER